MKTVKEVSERCGVSVRTLHHYHAIGLLVPTAVSEAGYRLYDDDAVARLRSILLFRALRFSLAQIKTMLQTEDFSAKGIAEALKNGTFYASQGPRVKQVEVTDNTVTVTCSECVTAVFYSNSPWVGGRAKITPEGGTEYRYDIQPSDRFIRIELIDKNGNKAWISPFAVNEGANFFDKIN